jgi:hypothetical protein
MSLVLQAVANPQAVPGFDPQAALNHLWVCIDRVSEADMTRDTYYIVSRVGWVESSKTHRGPAPGLVRF